MLCDAPRYPRTACLPTLRVPSPILCTVENLSSFSFLEYIMILFSSECFCILFPSRKIFHCLRPIFISLFRSLLKRKLSLQHPWRLCTPATLHQSYWPCCVVPSATSTLPFVFVKNINNNNNGYLNRPLPHCQTDSYWSSQSGGRGTCTAWTHCSKDVSCPTCYGRQAEESHHTP